MDKGSIIPILDYYIDYEFQTRMMDNSIKGKGSDEPISILDNGIKIKRAITTKKIKTVWDKLIKSIKNDKREIIEQENEIKERIKCIFENSTEIDDFVKRFDFKYENQKNELIQIIRSLKENDKITVCYPILESDKSKKPLVTFNCILLQDKFIVSEYYVNRECLLIILAYIENCSVKEIELDSGERFTNLYKKINSIENQKSIHETIKIMDREIFSEYSSEKIKSILDFKNNDGWRKLNRVFITAEELEELQLPIFKEEIQICKDKYNENGCLPSVLEKYILGNENAIEFELISKEFKFHYGSYTDKYPINERQWNIVTTSDKVELLAVDGPPGTGKTTLLKELIADQITQKAKALIDVWDKEWTVSAKEVSVSPLGGLNKYSIVVTSTNNMAVDNIGVELLKEIPYLSSFMGSAKTAYRGMLCAKLGKRENVTSFYTDQFQSLIESLSGIKDDTLNENVVEEFKSMWGELYQIKEKIFEFISEQEKICKLLQIEAAQIDLIDKTYTQISEELIQTRSTLIDEENNKKDILSNIESIEKKIRNLKSNKIVLQNEDSDEEEKRRKLYVNLEEYKEKSKYRLYKWAMTCISKKWRDFFHKNPSEEYLQDKINNSHDKTKKIENEISDSLKNEKILEDEKDNLENCKDIIEMNINSIKKQIRNLENRLVSIDSYKIKCKNIENVLNIKDASYKSQYMLTNCEKIYKLRKSLFDKGLEVTEIYIIKNRQHILKNLNIILKRSDTMLRWCESFYNPKQSYSEDWKEAIFALWETFFLCFPVATTTLHSFKKEMFQILPNLIDLLMVDESGQILPHYLCAPLYRSKRAIIVGDIHQLEPIRLLKNNLIANSNVNEVLHNRICTEQNSAQSYADNSSDIFEFEDNNKTGIVLNEHRRCEKSIMEFSNKNIYKEKLIVVTPDNNDKLFGSNLIAFDIRGAKGKYHYNKLEINACKKIIQEYKERYGEDVVNNIAIISPFSKQVDALKAELPEVEIGTVHTFQGKEKDYIIFTAVIDNVGGKNSGLSDFIGLKGNLLNVAFSRAKKQFVLVGNLDQISKGSKFLKEALKTIKEYGIVYSFFDSELKFNDLSELELQNWESASRVLAAEDDQILDLNKELSLFIQEYCPKKIIIGPAIHYEILKGVIGLAKQNIYIFSPWISNYVVDDRFVELVSVAVRNKVKLHICFGYKGKRGALDSEEHIEEVLIANGGFCRDIKETAKAILYLKEQLGVNIIHFPPIHTKLLLIDNRYMFIGSHNWLQNSGKGNNQYKEMSCLVTSDDSIMFVKDRYIDRFFENY